MGCFVTKSSRDNFQFESQWDSLDIRVGFPPRMTTITFIVDGKCKTVKEVKQDLLVNSSTEGENLDLFLCRNNRRPTLLEDDREFIKYREYIIGEGDESYLQFYPRQPADENYPNINEECGTFREYAAPAVTYISCHIPGKHNYRSQIRIVRKDRAFKEVMRLVLCQSV